MRRFVIRVSRLNQTCSMRTIVRNPRNKYQMTRNGLEFKWNTFMLKSLTTQRPTIYEKRHKLNYVILLCYVIAALISVRCYTPVRTGMCFIY